MTVLETLRRALRLMDRRSRRRLGLISVANVLAAGLDTLGILLLVPLLAYLGSEAPSGATTDFARDVLDTTYPGKIALWFAGASALVFIAKSVFSVSLQWTQLGVVNRAEERMADRMLKTFTETSWVTQQDVSSGALLRTVNFSIGQVGGLVSAAVVIVADSATFVAIGAALLIVSPLMAIGVVALLGLVGLFYLRAVRVRVNRRSIELQHAQWQMNRVLLELVGGVKELIIRGTSDVYVKRFGDSFGKSNAALRTISVASFATRYLLESALVVGATVAIAIAVAGGSSQSGLVAIGVLIAGGVRLLPALSRLLAYWNQIRSCEPAVTVVEEDFARLNSGIPLRPAERVGETQPTGAFALDAVSFRYPSRETDALTAISVDVPSGGALGVVGATGAGKSTFVDLLLGLLEPSAGQILVDGHPLSERLGNWRSVLGFVPQDIFLADDTLAANVAFGSTETTSSDERLAEALGLAHLGDVVQQLTDGTESVIGERGVRLSGGQRQRLGIARALYNRPRVLVLDEATSALDNETEFQITEALRELHGRLTMVIIAHRLSTVQACDRILYLEHGRVAGLGTFEELVHASDGFARLVELATLSAGELP